MATEIKKLIELPNRDGDKNYLEFLYKGRTKEKLIWYKLVLEQDLGVSCGYKRRPRRYINIDPSGGPLMHIDMFSIKGMTLRKIIAKKGIGFYLGFTLNSDNNNK